MTVEEVRPDTETALVSKRESQNSEGAEGAVGEGESGEEEWLTVWPMRSNLRKW